MIHHFKEAFLDGLELGCFLFGFLLCMATIVLFIAITVLGFMYSPWFFLLLIPTIGLIGFAFKLVTDRI